MISGCFRRPNTASSNNNSCSHMPENLVTCIYQTRLCNSPTYLTLSWSRTLFSHSLTIHASDIFSITISLCSSTFSFFQTRQGSKSIHNQYFKKMKLHWNFTKAEFIQNSAEPDSCFYFAISYKGKLQFFLGDLHHDLTNTTTQHPVLLSRREHVFGSKSYISRAVFMGTKHEIKIEYSGGVLRVKVDGKTHLVVKRLEWKFRGYEKILIDGIEVEFYWDVLSWVVNTTNNDSNDKGHGVFVFQIGDGTVWPEMVGSAEKRLMKKSLSSPSVLQWAEENSASECGRTSSSSSTKSSGSNVSGFSLLLYAWTKN